MLIPETKMRSKLLDLLYSEQRILPNKFTVAVGELIRKARLEAKLSQEDLAEQAYLKQSSISKIEAGVRSLSIEDLLYLSFSLNKPVTYFFPKKFLEELGTDEHAMLEDELLLQSRRLGKDDLERLIAQARGLADFQKQKVREAFGKKSEKREAEIPAISRNKK
ncbi:MAG: hypothetical protein MHPDNHAH_00431 [Anaerolineales bacterium]|nr:hypothetical protein [Anaerolineales bacterium]